MKRKNMARNALFTSIISLMLCVSMLVGTTFAWFTDSVTSANNIIKSGTLDVKMDWADGTEDPIAATWTDASTGAIFNHDLWEPGYTEVRHIKISNAGTLALKYQLLIKANGTVSALADVIDVYFADPAVQMTDRSLAGSEKVGTLTNVLAGMPTNAAGYLEAGETATITLALKMQESAGNEYQNLAIGTDFSVILYATQYTYESDSFDNQYDGGATYPIISAPSQIPTPDAGETGDITLESEQDVTIVVPADIVEELDNVTSLSLAHTEAKVDEDAKTVTFDAIDLIDQNGNVVELSNLNTNAELTITLPVGNAFAEGEEVTIYHDGVYIGTAEVANGNVTYNVAHLCEVVIKTYDPMTPNDAGVYEIANAAQLFDFAQQVNAGDDFAGKTVTLTADIDLANTKWTPIGNWDNAFAGTFDGNGKTISNLYINDAEGEGVGFFGVVVNATIKNLTIKNVNVNAYSMVAGVVGAAYPATISNCHVTGNVNIVAEWAYVAGVAGYCYYGTQVDGCSVVAASTGLIKSETRNGVGGITAWLLEGDHKVTNCAVENLNLVGWTNVGGITGFVHYDNTIENCSVKNVTLTKTRANGNPGIGLIAGGWSYNANNEITLKNNTVNGATLNGTHMNYSAYNELYGSEYGGATTTNFVLENNTISGVKNNLLAGNIVTTGDELKEALAAGKDVILGNDITIAATAGGYSKAGVVIDKGQTVDGNGHTLTVTGAGGTWDCAIYLTNGTVKNITVAGAMRGVFTAGQSNDLYLDNVTFKNVVYTFNSDDGSKDYTIYISNSTMNGWTSHSDVHKAVVYTDCEFGEGSGYAFCRPYGPTEFVGCDFAEGYEIDARGAVTFENCTINGVALTAENLATLVISNTANATIK